MITDLLYIPRFLCPQEADELLVHSREMDWQQNEITMYAKTMPLPRLEVMMGDTGCSYRYARVQLEAAPWDVQLKVLRDAVQDATGHRYQVVIGNYYRDGNDHIGWHSDDSPEMGQQPAIASISLGTTRIFQVRDNATNQMKSFDLAHGDLLFMPAGFQATHKHRLKKQPKSDGDRINWTFRPHVGGEGYGQPVRTAHDSRQHAMV